MTLPTVNVTGQVCDLAGNGIAAAIVTVKLSGADLYNGEYITATEQSYTANGTGNFTLPIFPNALGSLNTCYTIKLKSADGNTVHRTVNCVVPNLNCTLASIEGTGPATPSNTIQSIEYAINVPFWDQTVSFLSLLKNFNTAVRNYVFPDVSGTLFVLTGALAAGMVSAQGDGSFGTSRTLTGTANQVVVTNGDGAAGNPTFSLPQSIHTAATPTFAGMTLSGALAANGGITVPTAQAITGTGTASISGFDSISATGFTGALTGNVTGNVSGSSGSATGNAATATALQTARAINGVSFDGTAAITVTAAADTLTGTTLATGVTASSLTSLGTLTSVSTSGQITSTLPTGTAPFVISSTTVVGNLNVSQLLGATWAAPGSIGSGTPNSGAFTTLGVSGVFTYGGVALTAAVTGIGKMVLDTSPTLVTPALGTPASGVATNLTGTAAGLTAGNVTTNANLTGPITSAGNATSVASQTGTGSKFVMDTSPTLITPNIGAATGASLVLTGDITVGGTLFAGTINDIGVAGFRGFGVGICPALPAGFSTLTGTLDRTSDQYGNYQYSDGSIMCWIPAIYYKFGTGANGLAINAVSIKPLAAYANEAAANAAGYALHRADYDNGTAQLGQFVDKYICSKNGTTASSIKNGNPLSSNAAHNQFSDLSGAPANFYYGAIAAAKTRGANFFCNSRFIFAKLALLAYAHAQASSNTTWCAWYDATYNTPKGCNNSALGDDRDATLVFTTDGYSTAAKTGSANYLAKTTHNGQACGVADLNGCMWEVTPGLATDAAGTTYYVLKTSAAMKSVTGGNTGATDLWGATGIAALYDSLGATYGAALASSTAKLYGAATQVLSEATSGNVWNWAGAGGPLAAGVGGTNPFGSDGFWDYRPADMCPISGGGWSDSASAGVWALHLTNVRGGSYDTVGFRAALYL